MGGFTGDRHALLITDNGGKLVTTPAYKLKENTQLRNTRATLAPDGSLKMHIQSSYKAMLQDELQMMINGLSKDKVKDYLHEELDLPTYEISHFEYHETKAALPEINESLDIDAENYATVTGKRLFIVPNIISRFNRRLSPDDSRKYDIVLNLEYRETDSTEIVLPEGYGPESLPADVFLDTKFGKYRCSVKLDKNKIFYYRNFEKYSGRFEPTAYNELVKFYDSVYKADRNKIVLVKNP